MPLRSLFMPTLFVFALLLNGCSAKQDPCGVGVYLNDDGSLKSSDVHHLGECKSTPRRCGDPLF